MPTVTVLMPVYNGEKYLREAIDSILSQKYKDFEFLIVDDGSTDSTAEIISGYTDPRIVVLKNPVRLKLSGTLNRGIDEAQGEFIARMDADDISLPDRLLTQLTYMKSKPDIGICGSWMKQFGACQKNIIKNYVHADTIKAYTLFAGAFAHPTVMFRRSLFQKYGLRYNGDYYPTEDYELWSRAVDCFPCANLNKVLLKYRVHKKSMTGSDWDKMDFKGMLITENILKKLGVDYTENQIVMHRNIARGDGFRIKKVGDLGEVEKWLGHIAERNKKILWCSTESLRTVMSLLWFRQCFNNTWLGFDVFKRYHSSIFFQKNTEGLKQALLMFLSTLKHRYLKMLT